MSSVLSPSLPRIAPSISSPGNPEIWRDYRLCLSFANLIYLRAWADLIPLRSEGLFTRKSVPGFGLYFALVADVLALSLLIFVLIQAVHHFGPRASEWVQRAWPAIAIAVLSLSIRFLGAHLPGVIPRIVPVALLAATLLALPFYAVAAKAIRVFTLAATPCLAITFLAPLFYLSGPSPLPPDPPLAARLSGSPPVRVIRMVFDDWDQRLTFGDPDGGPGIETGLASMPALQLLGTSSFAASRALAAQAGSTPVYDMSTLAAIPSLIYGKDAIGYSTESPAVRHLVFAGRSSESVVFGSGDSIFSRVRSLGWNATIAGWHLPYCRIFAPQVTDCFWDERFDQASAASRQQLNAAADETRMLFESDMYSPFGRSLVVERHYEEYETLLAAARRYAADPDIGVAFIHLNVPHMPWFDNPGLSTLLRRQSSDDHYLHALPWVDRAIAAVVSSLGASGLDAKTAIILSSDHPARLISKTTPYVPFIVHLPNQTEPVTMNEEFSALQSADLVLAIARGEIQSPEDIAKFLLHRE